MNTIIELLSSKDPNNFHLAEIMIISMIKNDDIENLNPLQQFLNYGAYSVNSFEINDGIVHIKELVNNYFNNKNP